MISLKLVEQAETDETELADGDSTDFAVCENCRFFFPEEPRIVKRWFRKKKLIESKYGICARFPPHPTSWFPTVRFETWCGEWRGEEEE